MSFLGGNEFALIFQLSPQWPKFGQAYNNHQYFFSKKQKNIWPKSIGLSHQTCVAECFYFRRLDSLGHKNYTPDFFQGFFCAFFLVHNKFKKKNIRSGLVLGANHNFDGLRHNIHGHFFYLMHFSPYFFKIQFNPLIPMIFLFSLK